MGDFKEPLVQRQKAPLTCLRHNRSCSEGNNAVSATDNKENVVSFGGGGVDKENAAPPTANTGCSPSSVAKKAATHLKSLSTIGTFDTTKQVSGYKSLSTGNVLKESSLQLCMQMNEPERALGCKLWDPIDSENSSSLNVWDYSDSEAAPASSWSTLPNRLVSECSLVFLLVALNILLTQRQVQILKMWRKFWG